MIAQAQSRAWYLLTVAMEFQYFRCSNYFSCFLLSYSTALSVCTDSKILLEFCSVVIGYFSSFQLVFIHVRGGGELGDGWLLKPTEVEKSFDDLVAGVEYLKGKSYGNIIDSNKIAFFGASHGGLVGAVAMNMKRDLFRTVIVLNANMDLVNDLPHKGRIWAKQYGNLSNKSDFECIKRYAPLLHIQQPTKSDDSYPTTLVVASRNDEVVSIANSIKYLAHRREKAENNDFQKDKPTLLKVINNGGHHYETAKKMEIIDAVFVKLQFLAESMELKFDKLYRSKYFKQQNSEKHNGQKK